MRVPSLILSALALLAAPLSADETVAVGETKTVKLTAPLNATWHGSVGDDAISYSRNLAAPPGEWWVDVTGKAEGKAFIVVGGKDGGASIAIVVTAKPPEPTPAPTEKGGPLPSLKPIGPPTVSPKLAIPPAKPVGMIAPASRPVAKNVRTPDPTVPRPSPAFQLTTGGQQFKAFATGKGTTARHAAVSSSSGIETSAAASTPISAPAIVLSGGTGRMGANCGTTG